MHDNNKMNENFFKLNSTYNYTQKYNKNYFNNVKFLL